MKRLLGSFGKLELIAFTSGFALMCFELVAARLLAPSIGASTYVWTSVIGVIIAALAIGYWVGGVVADRRNSRIDLAYLLLASAAAVLLAQVFYSGVLQYTVQWEADPRLQSVVVALLLFAPASFILGMISPYLAKLNVTSLSVSGRRVASLGALNSIGGIVGTFLTGFVLLGAVGSHQLLTYIVLLLVVASWLVVPREASGMRALASLAFIAASLAPATAVYGVQNIDTPSAHYQVVDYTYNDRPIVGLVTGPNGIQSAVYQDGDESLVFWYAREMARQALDQSPKQVLLLGGGAFTLPEYLVSASDDVEVDVVEIDPRLLDISKQYFGYQQSARVTEYFDDARRFVNSTDKIYDVIMVDVYGDGAIPFAFATSEYGRQIERLLADDGIVVVNIIGGLAGGPCQEVFAAVDAAYRERLPYGYYATETNQILLRGNVVVTYSRHPLAGGGLREIPVAAQPAFTDDRAPIEQLYHRCQLIG